MKRRVLLASMTYRHFMPSFVTGILDTERPDEETTKRLEPYDIENVIVQGYGGGRNAGTIIQGALDVGSDFLIFAECDMRFLARHVAQVLEAYDFLVLRNSGKPVVIGSVYPMSSDPRKQLIAVNEGESYWNIDSFDRRGILRRRIEAAVAAARDPTDMTRYEEVRMLPFGFICFPVTLFADAPPLVEQGGFRCEYKGFDQSVSAWLRSIGVKQYVDLSLDVGHASAVTLSTLEMLGKE